MIKLISEYLSWDKMNTTLFLLACLLLASSCATSTPSSQSQLENVIAKNAQQPQETDILNAELFAAAQSSAEPSNYLLGPGDLIQVTVFEEDDLNTLVRVANDGAITLPLIGSIEVKGLSAREVEKLIEHTYGEKYLQNPRVSVFVKEQLGSKITLLGAVAKPGAYDYFTRQKLLSVLAMAGGLSSDAGTMVQVRRNGDQPNEVSTYIIDLKDLLTMKDQELNIYIAPNDILFVPKSGSLYVDGAVNNPGVYPLKSDLTVLEALAIAGGTAWWADKSIKLLRRTGGGKTEVIEMNIDDIKVADVHLKDRDILFVETSPLKQAFFGMRLSILGTGISFSPARAK